MGLFRHTLLFRFKSVNIKKVQDELQCFNFTVEQLSLMNEWTRKEISFVEQITVEEAMSDPEA